MMSRPDFMSKQVIFIESNKKNKLRFRNSNLLLVDENNKILLQHSCHKIFLIFVYGEFSITSILPDIFDPPRIAVKGRLGSDTAFPR